MRHLACVACHCSRLEDACALQKSLVCSTSGAHHRMRRKQIWQGSGNPTTSQIHVRCGAVFTCSRAHCIFSAGLHLAACPYAVAVHARIVHWPSCDFHATRLTGDCLVHHDASMAMHTATCWVGDWVVMILPCGVLESRSHAGWGVQPRAVRAHEHLFPACI